MRSFSFFNTIYYDFLGETIMAKRKDLLLTEATISRMMGIAGIGSLANPFLKEQVEEEM